MTRRSVEVEPQLRAACRDVDPELFFPPDDATAEAVRRQEAIAKAVCRTCPLAGLCLATALDERWEYGVWGGLTAEDRKAVHASRSGARPMPESGRTTDPTKRTRVRRRTTARRTAPAMVATAGVSE